MGAVMLNTALHGFGVGLSLIVAIGAQNAFVLKQGLKLQHIFWVCLLCAVSDAVLIGIGVLGFAQLTVMNENWLIAAKYFGAVFLFIYGAQHFYQAYVAKNKMSESEQGGHSLAKVLLICLALTWLNPHVYLDTVILLGSISSQYNDTKWYFAFGAMCASFLFFFSLGYAARFLQPIFQRPQAWRILDVLIGVIMWSIAYSLL